MNIIFAVATHSKYMNQTLPILFGSMKKNNIKNSQIRVFVNEAESDDTVEKDGIIYYNSKESTCFEWIIPKLILKNNLQSDWWFLLHDTVILGDTFLTKVSTHNNQDKKIIMISTMSNNMGMIKNEVFYEYINYFEDCIKELSNIPNVLDKKLWVVQRENDYLKIDGLRMYFYNNPKYENLEPTKYCGSTRHVEYFPNVDLYKMKKNNGTKGLEVTL